MSFPAWRYGAYALAVAVTLSVATANVAWAWGLDDGVYRYVMITVSVCADVGCVIAFLAMHHYFAESDPASVCACLLIWLACGYAEIKGAETWFRSNTFYVSSPSAKAAEERNVAVLDTAREEENLSSIRKSLASERRESIRDDLHKREKESLSRIDKLRPKTFSTNVAPVATQYDGKELLLSFALWLLSQAAWRMAIGRKKTSAQEDSHPLSVAVRRTDDLSGQPRTRDADSRTQTAGQPDKLALSAPLSELSGQTDSVGQRPPDSPDKGADNSQCVEKTMADTVRTQQEPLSGRPCLSVVSGQTDKSVRTAGHGQPDTDSRTRTAGQSGALSDFERRVSDLRKAGFTVRQIVEKTGEKKHAVEGAMKAIKARTTSGSA